MTLNERQIEQYSRQILVSEIGGRGQCQILDARMLVAGPTDLALAVADFLAAAGVGHLYLDTEPAAAGLAVDALRARNQDSLVTSWPSSGTAPPIDVVVRILSGPRRASDRSALLEGAKLVEGRLDGDRITIRIGDAPASGGADGQTANDGSPVASLLLASELALAAVRLALGWPVASPTIHHDLGGARFGEDGSIPA